MEQFALTRALQGTCVSPVQHAITLQVTDRLIGNREAVRYDQPAYTASDTRKSFQENHFYTEKNPTTKEAYFKIIGTWHIH